MKKTVLFSVAFILGILVIIAGCKKEDEKIVNRITLAGNTTSEYNKEYTPVNAYYNAPALVQCVSTIYSTQIWIEFTPASALYIEIIQESSTVHIPVGKLNVCTAECQPGFYAVFYPVAGKNGGLAVSGGTINISKDGSDYNVDLNLTIHSETGGGTIKGNFNGPIPKTISR